MRGVQPLRLDAAHRSSSIEAHFLGRAYLYQDSANDDFCSRMHAVKLILKFALDFAETLVQPAVGDELRDCAEGGHG